MAFRTLALGLVVVIGRSPGASVHYYSHPYEAQAIGQVLADLPSDLVTEVIVVDSNSSDGTPEIAAKTGARVIQEHRRGRAEELCLAPAKAPRTARWLRAAQSRTGTRKL